MESSGKLRQRLARMFRSACKPSAVLDRRQHPDALDPVDCGGCRAQGERRSSVWRGKEKRVRETGRCYEAGDWEGRTCPPTSSPSSSFYYHYCFHGCAPREDVCSWRRSGRTIEKRNAMRLRPDAYGFTSSSSSETDDGFFSREEEKEESTTTTFFSSRSFSSYSSEFYASAKKSKKVAVRRGSKRREAEAAHWPAGGCKGGGFQPLVAVNDGGKKKKKKREGLLAVEKRSRNPYKDFRRSMVEMIVERQMFRPQDLENLLQSYLALNPSPLHPLILQAFSDIWVLLFHH